MNKMCFKKAADCSRLPGKETRIMDQVLNQKIDAFIAENTEKILQDIGALVAVDSVEGTPEEGAPFG